MSGKNPEQKPEQKQSAFIPGRHPIDSYGNGGFRFAGLSHQGSLLALPTGIQSWQISRATAIDVDSLIPVLVEMEKIDVLLIGTGEKALPQSAAFAQALRALGLHVEVMDTPAAARTYNLLFDQGRRVAAALLAV